MRLATTILSIILLVPACSRPEAPEDEAAVAGSGLPRLVDLGSESCVPCRMMQPELEHLRTTMEGSLEVVFIDVNQDRSAASDYRIRVIPTQIFFSPEGVELTRHEGYIDAEGILGIFREHGCLNDDGV